MRYKILVVIGLLNILSAAYAMDNPGASHSTYPSTAVKSTNSADPYQYCFQNSTWVVPPQTLLAYLYDNANVIPVSDQTVWVISNYNHGYFSGISYSAINNNLLSQRYLIGSVTPAGHVYITFYSGTSTNSDLVTGLGNLTAKSSGQCFFTMQMNSGQNGVSGLTHWSYMLPANPGDFFYSHLPGTNMSVPEFLAQF